MQARPARLVLTCLVTAMGVVGTDIVHANDLERWQGVWRLSSLEANGKKLELPTASELVVVGSVRTICSEKFVITRQPIAIDSHSRPRRVDIGVDDFASFQGIYEFTGDQLRVCYPRSANVLPPKSFEIASRSDHILETFQRIEPADALPLSRLVLLGPDVVRITKDGQTPFVREIALTGETVDDDVLADVAEIETLRKIMLSMTAVTDSGLRHLEGLKELKTLALVRNKDISDAAAAAFSQKTSVALEDEDDLRKQLEQVQAEIEQLSRKKSLRALGLGYHQFLEGREWGPKNLAEFEKTPVGTLIFDKKLAAQENRDWQTGLKRVRNGEVVLIFRAGFQGLTKKQPGEKKSPLNEYVLGYESQVPNSGGFVLLGDGEIREMSPAEFRKLPRIPTEPGSGQ